jgi:hypothetical protein
MIHFPAFVLRASIPLRLRWNLLNPYTPASRTGVWFPLRRDYLTLIKDYLRRGFCLAVLVMIQVVEEDGQQNSEQ